MQKGSVLKAFMVRNTDESTATSLRERCTAGSKPDGREVNSLTRKKPNQAVQKAAQNMAWSKSATEGSEGQEDEAIE